MESEIYSVYTDGSFSPNMVKWAFMAYDKNDVLVKKDGGFITDPEIVMGRQIGGELQAVIEAVKWAKLNNVRIKVFFDYLGILLWVNDLFTDGKPWKRTLFYTQNYRQFIEEHKQYIVKFVKISAHSGHDKNDKVDLLAKSQGK